MRNLRKKLRNLRKKRSSLDTFSLYSNYLDMTRFLEFLKFLQKKFLEFLEIFWKKTFFTKVGWPFAKKKSLNIHMPLATKAHVCFLPKLFKAVYARK